MVVSEQFMTCFVMMYDVLEKMVDQRHKKPQKASLLGVKKARSSSARQERIAGSRVIAALVMRRADETCMPVQCLYEVEKE